MQKLVVVITGAESGEVLERWVFNVETDKSVGDDPYVPRMHTHARAHRRRPAPHMRRAAHALAARARRSRSARL